MNEKWKTSKNATNNTQKLFRQIKTKIPTKPCEILLLTG